MALALIGGVASGIGLSHGRHAGVAAAHQPETAELSQTSPASGKTSTVTPTPGGPGSTTKHGLDLSDDLQTRNGLSNGRFTPAQSQAGSSGSSADGWRTAGAQPGNSGPGLAGWLGSAQGAENGSGAAGWRPAGAARCPVVSARLGLHWPYSPYPENSAAAIEAAHRAGAPKVEIDVGFSRDGVPMVLHDATIDRVTAHTGSVTSYTAAKLESFPLKVGNQQMSDQHVLSLSDALRRIKADGMRVSIEIKPDVLTAGQARAIVQRLQPLNYWHMLDVRSFDAPVLAMMRRADPRVHTTLIVRRPVLPAPPGLVMESIDYHWRGSVLRPSVVRALHAEGLQVDAFTPDTEAGFAAVPHTVDQITTNNVGGAHAFLKARGC